MDNVYLNKDFKSEISRWVKLQELITTYDPQCRVKRSIVQSHDSAPDAWIDSRLCNLEKLSRIPSSDIAQIVSLFAECANITLANYGPGSRQDTDLLDGLDYHIRKMWGTYFPRINPEFGSIPTDIQINILLLLIKTEPENRLLIREVLENALFSEEV